MLAWTLVQNVFLSVQVRKQNITGSYFGKLPEIQQYVSLYRQVNW